uniref:Uncharacterized protein n=1 Tax=Arundo donax TaxID=35708 RepID=A0A0A9FQ36_ARUDO
MIYLDLPLILCSLCCMLTAKSLKYPLAIYVLISFGLSAVQLRR